MKNRFIIIIILLSFAAADIEFDFAENLYKNHNFYEAKLEYEKYLFFNPNTKYKNHIEYKIAECYYHGGYFDKSIYFLTNHMSDKKEIIKFNYQFLIAKNLYQKKAYQNCIYTINEIIDYASKTDTSTDLLKNSSVLNDAGLIFLSTTQLHLLKYENLLTAYQKNSSQLKMSQIQNDYQEVINFLHINNNIHRKNPALAGILSIIPGGGQIYNKRYNDAIKVLIYNGLFTGLTFYLWNIESAKTVSRRNYTLPGITGTAAALFYMANIYNAVNLSIHFNRNAVNEKKAEVRNMLMQISVEYKLDL